jgi:anaerobic selenocysteine-containing dehydrogenase
MKHSILARKIYKFLNIVEVKGGLVTQIKLDRNDPMNKGSICPKSIASVQLLYHPDRL